MNELAHAAPHEPSEHWTLANKQRRLVSLAAPAYALLNRLAVIRGTSMSDTLYIALRDDLHRQENGEGWAYIPPPFSIVPAYFETWCGVKLWNPFLPTVMLTASEACSLATGIHKVVESDSPVHFELISGYEAHHVSLSRGPTHVILLIDGERFNMPRPIALDVAAALESASVHAGPILPVAV
jgi:hypothetical protein